MSPPPGHWLGDAETKPAPEPLDRVQALVNTIEMPEGQDRLADAGDARAWLVSVGLLDDGADLPPDDLTLVRGVREALRAMLVSNAGGPRPTDSELRPLRAVAESGTVRAESGADGEIVLSAVGDSAPARMIELLLIIRDAQRDGTWARLKACANDECHWAFYDRSRNHGGTWCDMATCGNKLKNREFRARRRQH